MSDSLRDQLLKLGLVTQKQVSEAENKKHRSPPKNRPPKSAAHTPRPQTPVPAVALAAKPALDVAAQKKAEKERMRILRAEIRNLLNERRLNHKDAAEVYRFVIGTHIKQTYVTTEQRDALQKGELAVVLFDARCQLVSLETALDVRNKLSLIPVYIATEAQASGDIASGEVTDDEYGDYKIPDDFMW